MSKSSDPTINYNDRQHDEETTWWTYSMVNRQGPLPLIKTFYEHYQTSTYLVFTIFIKIQQSQRTNIVSRYLKKKTKHNSAQFLSNS